MAGYIYYGEILMGSAGVIPSTSCTITFSVNPNDAEITVNGDILSGNTYIAEIGETVSYSISKYGYGTETGSLTASTDETVTVALANYLTQYLTFNIISGGTIVWKAKNTGYTITISYRKNSGKTWTNITSNTGASAPSIPVSAGDIVQFKGNNATYFSGDSRYNYFSGSTAKFEVEGNIMSLIDSENFATATTLVSGYTFKQLFSNCTGLTSAENLILPATTLASYCYSTMFRNCTSLTTAPELPATTLVLGCYSSMFERCAGLTTAPGLPATTLANSCYFFMFSGCTSLTTAPELPATTLAEGCYQFMFSGCRNLTTAPELPATTLAGGCYDGMFQGCTNLNYIKAMFTTTPSRDYTRNWVGGVASSGTFVKNSAAMWDVTGDNGVPTGWIVQDAS